MKLLLQHLHPEIVVEAHDTNLNSVFLKQDASKNDMIIFTIGSTDQQLKFNKQLKQQKCSIPVLYAWIEEGGTNSHILYVDYRNKGCYECLYTDINGNHVSNRAMKNLDPTILLYDKGSEDLTYQYVMTLHDRIRE